LFEELIRRMVLEHDIAEFRAVLEAHGILRRNAPFGNDDVRAYFGHFYEFVMEDQVLTLSPEYAAESVRRIFDLCAMGEGLKGITKILNADGVGAPRAQRGRPRAWSPSSVRWRWLRRMSPRAGRPGWTRRGRCEGWSRSLRIGAGQMRGR